MHELSLASEVVRIAEKAAEDNNAMGIEEITIEVGSLSGVDADAFRSALDLVKAGTILEYAGIVIEKTKAKGYCAACKNEFDLDYRFGCCPSCNAFPSEVNGGTGFRIVSFLIETS